MKKRYLSKVLGTMLMCGVLFGTSPAWASAAQNSSELLQGQVLETVSDSLLEGVTLGTVEEPSVRETTEYQLTIPHTKQSGDNNYFIFPEGKWTAGNANHTWSNTPDATNPETTYYEVKFVGHKIDVYAGKNQPMGKVKYYIDGVEKGEYDLYRSSNIDSEKIATFDNLGEGPHIFRAEATGTKNDSATGTLIDAAQVVVYHNRYEVESIQQPILLLISR
ncbi:MAG: hypothetical protein IKM28_02010 [Lachnospiraceae bacterium]|nr:hypothetical protein [Lachnospiraceae bacterium]